MSASAEPGLQLALIRDTSAWTPSKSRMALWASAALGRRARGCGLSVRVVSRAESRRLNRRWRHVDKPTNVLSFPAYSAALPAAGRPVPLGDLVVCPPVVRAEAIEQRKTLTAH